MTAIGITAITVGGTVFVAMLPNGGLLSLVVTPFAASAAALIVALTFRKAEDQDVLQGEFSSTDEMVSALRSMTETAAYNDRDSGEPTGRGMLKRA